MMTSSKSESEDAKISSENDPRLDEAVGLLRRREIFLCNSISLLSLLVESCIRLSPQVIKQRTNLCED